jgi:hypothetical protein
MTTPKELADKAMQQADVRQEAWHDYMNALRIDVHGEIVSTSTAHLKAHNDLRATIDQLQAMAEARQGSGEPVAWMWQHEETGRVGFVDDWQVQHGWQAGNPRCKIITALVRPSAQQATDAVEQWGHIANEWADMATNGVQWLRNISEGISDADTALKDMESNCKRIQAIPRPPSAQQATGKFFDRLQEIKATPAGREMLRQAMQGDEDCAKATGSGQVLTDAAAISILGSAMAKAAGRNLPNDNAWLLAGARAILAAATQAQPEVTDEMVTAYLKANDAYWQRTDTAPATDPSRWRNGNPRDATRESLRAALAAPTTGKREPLPDGFQLVAVKGFDDLVYWLDRCADKGHLEQCSDLIEPWAAFEFRRLDGITGEQR